MLVQHHCVDCAEDLPNSSELNERQKQTLAAESQLIEVGLLPPGCAGPAAAPWLQLEWEQFWCLVVGEPPAWERHGRWWGEKAGRKNEGSSWLTAFVVRSFSEASEYISVESEVVQKSINWLMESQQEDGCFEKRGYVHSSTLK